MSREKNTSGSTKSATEKADLRTFEYLAENLPLEKLSRGLARIAERLNAHRKASGGFTPRPLFLPCLAIGGVYACKEFILAVGDSHGNIHGYALKLRDPLDQGWHGLYHIPGSITRRTDTLTKPAFDRLLAEVTDDLGMAKFFRDSMKLVDEGHYDVTERDTVAQTSIYFLNIGNFDVKSLKGTWRVFAPTELDSPKIVDLHRRVLKRIDIRRRTNFR